MLGIAARLVIATVDHIKSDDSVIPAAVRPAAIASDMAAVSDAKCSSFRARSRNRSCKSVVYREAKD